jgi:hypothetical protein
MNSHPVHLLAPVFHFLDRMIHEHGDILYMLFVYVAVPLAAWLLGRRCARKKIKRGNTFVLVIRPPGKTLSPVSRWTFESEDDANGPFGG